MPYYRRPYYSRYPWRSQYKKPYGNKKNKKNSKKIVKGIPSDRKQLYSFRVAVVVPIGSYVYPLSIADLKAVNGVSVGFSICRLTIWLTY